MPDRIETVMRAEFLTLRPEMPIREAVAALTRSDAAAAPVLDETGAILGMMTHRDCFRSVLAASYYHQWSGTVADHMTPGAAVLEADTDFVTAAEAFLDQPYRSYPVVRDGRLVGLLHRGDLLRALLDLGG
ncbi:MAG: CBS domain-containing protein [Rhodobacteraceae bacterium]|jgi:CBS domain-containing protein|nr:CBS domain-containing protein [Paracoccaceae bacterium]